MASVRPSLRTTGLVAAGVAGVVLAHGLDYLLIVRSSATRAATLAETGHGWWPAAVAAALGAACLATSMATVAAAVVAALHLCERAGASVAGGVLAARSRRPRVRRPAAVPPTLPAPVSAGPLGRHEGRGPPPAIAA